MFTWLLNFPTQIYKPQTELTIEKFNLQLIPKTIKIIELDIQQQEKLYHNLIN